MEAELAALASSGATALVGLMVSDSWARVKDGFARMLGKSAPAEAPLEELEISRVELVTACLEHDDAKVAAIESHWRSRLESLLRSDETAVDALRRLLSAPTPSPVETISNFISGDMQFGSIIQAGHISGATFHMAPTSGERLDKHDALRPAN
ncbi:MULTISPECIES: hypothetical protein [Actinomadura]|uniref:Uncharacterized protein n=1 Tax=Actinomadura geliboluensis TaxID=882440 RepID=A0A5S4GWW8_9ACTN|nr:hypothetical protein [Actinomadura geliboluensis]TMR37406.1 hypothetical protein ETD96_18620 [Actinomadura geliboluensis]